MTAVECFERQHPARRVVGDLLTAEINEKQARSIKYQLTMAKLPLAKDIAGFDFTGTPTNEGLVRELATGGFLAHQRNAVVVGGTGTGKTHLAIAIGRACVRSGARVRFYNTVDLVNRSRPRHVPGAPGASPTTCRGSISSSSTSSATCRSRCRVASCCSIVSRLYEQTSVIVTTNLAFGDPKTISGRLPRLSSRARSRRRMVWCAGGSSI